MSECITCKALKNCLTFQDFANSPATDTLYISSAQIITVICPSGITSTVPLDAGTVGFILNFQLGNPPYPALMLNCTGGTITVPVPDDTTQAQLVVLINGLLNTCLNQIASSIGCAAGVFFNTPQFYNPCEFGTGILGALPAGVSLPVTNDGLIMAGGIVQSTISVADANAKAQQVLGEIYSTGNAICHTSA